MDAISSFISEGSNCCQLHFHPLYLLFCGYCDKLPPQTVWLITTEMYSLIILEPESKIKHCSAYSLLEAQENPSAFFQCCMCSLAILQLSCLRAHHSLLLTCPLLYHLLFGMSLTKILFTEFGVTQISQCLLRSLT